MGYNVETMNCPYCDGVCHADHVDVGVGMMKCGPYLCEDCGANEIGPEMKFEELTDENGNYGGQGELLNPEDFTKEEIETGFYRKGRLSPYANTVNGELVNHDEALEMYKKGKLDKSNFK